MVKVCDSIKDELKTTLCLCENSMFIIPFSAKVMHHEFMLVGNPIQFKNKKNKQTRIKFYTQMSVSLAETLNW